MKVYAAAVLALGATSSTTAFVATHHRHHAPPTQALFAASSSDGDNAKGRENIGWFGPAAATLAGLTVGSTVAMAAAVPPPPQASINNIMTYTATETATTTTIGNSQSCKFRDVLCHHSQWVSLKTTRNDGRNEGKWIEGKSTSQEIELKEL